MPDGIRNNDQLRAQQTLNMRGVGENGAPHSDRGAQVADGAAIDFGSIVSSMFGGSVGGGIGGRVGGAISGLATFSVANGGVRSAFSVNGDHIGASARGRRDVGDRSSIGVGSAGSSRGVSAGAANGPGGARDQAGTDRVIVSDEDPSEDGSSRGSAGRAGGDVGIEIADRAGVVGGNATDDVVAASIVREMAAAAGLPTTAELSPTTVGQFNTLLLSGDRGVRPGVMTTEQASADRLGNHDQGPGTAGNKDANGVARVSVDAAALMHSGQDRSWSMEKVTNTSAAKVDLREPVGVVRSGENLDRRSVIGLAAGGASSVSRAGSQAESALHTQQNSQLIDNRAAERGAGRADAHGSRALPVDEQTHVRAGGQRHHQQPGGVWRIESADRSETTGDAVYRPGLSIDVDVKRVAGEVKQPTKPNIGGSVNASAAEGSAGVSKPTGAQTTSAHNEGTSGNEHQQHQQQDHLKEGTGQHRQPTGSTADRDDGRRDEQLQSSSYARSVAEAGSGVVNSRESAAASQPRATAAEVLHDADASTQTGVRGEDVEETERLARQALSAQVSRGMSALLRGGSGGQAIIALAPAALGQMKIALKITDGTVSASFKPTTREARDLLSGSLDALRASLEAGGLRVDRLEVGPIEESGRENGGEDGAAEFAPADHRAMDRALIGKVSGVERPGRNMSAEPTDSTTERKGRASAEVRLRLDATA